MWEGVCRIAYTDLARGAKNEFNGKRYIKIENDRYP